MKKILILSFCLMLMVFSLTACGNEAGGMGDGSGSGTGTGQNAGSESNNNTNHNNNLGSNIGNAIDDIGNAVDNVVNDVADGLTAGYETYDDAYNQFMRRLSDSTGRYEVRNNDKDLTEYTSGSQGYHFELHDTQKKENESKVGDFYMDSRTGKVYKSTGNNGKVVEYDFSDLR